MKKNVTGEQSSVFFPAPYLQVICKNLWSRPHWALKLVEKWCLGEMHKGQTLVENLPKNVNPCSQRTIASVYFTFPEV